MRRVAASALICLGLFVPAVFAQVAGGTIAGVVKDQAGAAVPGANDGRRVCGIARRG